jgi:hypothetical protein
LLQKRQQRESIRLCTSIALIIFHLGLRLRILREMSVFQRQQLHSHHHMGVPGMGTGELAAGELAGTKTARDLQDGGTERLSGM